MARILITGAAGFVGSSLVDRLLADGHDVVGVDSFEDYYPRRFKQANLEAARRHERFTMHEANLITLATSASTSVDSSTGSVDPNTGDGSPLAQVLEDVDVVYHLAAQAGVRASWGRSFRVYTDNNVLATQLLLEACRHVGLRTFVYASSSSVYGDTDRLPMSEDAVCRPVSPYGVTKLAAEHLAYLYRKNFGVPTVSLRFFTVYGPRQRPDMAFHKFIRAMLRGEPLEIYGSGDQTRDFTFIDDIVDGLVAAAQARPGSVYNLGGGSRVTLNHALGVLHDALGAEQKLDAQPDQAGDVRHTWADLTRARADLGYEPKVGLETGLAAEVEWLQGFE
ncbi:MAG TPA: NAD-dependent epimerase/dehydratase family protein [Thermoleophilia bacterium]|nr:NAD-dependent epimerase/dehydratase family protein [Thermoleophilia bacterium]